IVMIEVEPAQVVIAANAKQQLRVTAIDDQGGRRCATVEADYISNAPHIAEANSRGLLQASDVPGEAAVLVRYPGRLAVCRIVLPRPGSTFARPEESNFIDTHVW